ncbi:MAG: alpha/beta hydrolase [Pseudomonadota bacterium]
MSRSFYIFGTVLCLLILFFLAIRTPDTKVRAMEEAYGLGTVQRLCYGEEGNCVRIRDEGNPDGPALMLIHGSSDSLLTWRGMIDELAGDYRLLSLDLPGHGLSGPHVANRYDATAMMAAVTAFANNSGVERFTLIGNSMGGWISWRYALAHPERVAALVLVDASGAPLPADAEPPRLYLGAVLMKIRWLRPIIEQVTPRSIIKQSLIDSVYDENLITEAVVDEFWKLLRYPGNRRATAIRSTTDREPAYGTRLSEIAAPTLIVWGDADEVVPLEAANVFDREIPNSTLIIYKNIGHLPQRETPQALARDLKDFLGPLNRDVGASAFDTL